jgi:DNA-binding transcriptional MerR regulator
MAEIAAFTSDHVCRLTGLSLRQLRYWDKTGFFSPTLLDERSRRAFNRIYSFRDVVGLRTISVLRNTHELPLQELRRVGSWLAERHETPWSSLSFALHGKKVVFIDPDHGVAVEPRGAGQEVVSIALKPIEEDMREAAGRLRDRTPDQIGQLTRNRYVVHNAWVVAGTRIPTTAIWNFHEAGYSSSEIIREYPRLKEPDVKAAIEFEHARRSVA